MLSSKKQSHIDLFFTRGLHNNTDKNYIFQRYFHLSKNTLRENSNTNILFKQNLRVIKLLLHDIAELDMNQEKWNIFVVNVGKMNMNIYK